MANKDPERRARTRKGIMDAYWDVYAADPSRRPTVSAVVAASGVHRSTFYEYFDDADSVLAAIEGELAALFEAEAARALAGGAPDPAAIVRRVYVGHGERLSVLLGEGGDPRFARRVKDAMAPLVMGGLGLSEDGFGPYLAEFTVSGMLAVTTLWYGRGRDLDEDELGRGIRGLLQGIAAQAADESGKRLQRISIAPPCASDDEVQGTSDVKPSDRKGRLPFRSFS